MQNQAPLSLPLTLILATFIFLTSACTPLSTQPQEESITTPPAPAPSSQPTSKQTTQDSSNNKRNSPDFGSTPKGAFDEDTLYELLSAEIAAQRGRYDITLENYVGAAKRTGDVGIIKRAVRIAQFLKASNAQLQLAELWAKVEPKKVEAHQLAAFQYARKKDYANAILEMEKILELGGKSDLDRLAVNAKALPKEDLNKLLTLYEDLYSKHPKNDEVTYSLSILQQYTDNNEAALKTLTPVLERSPDYINAIILQGRILYSLKKTGKAAVLFRKTIKRFPKNRKLKTFYASLLIDLKKLDEAEQVFKELMEQFPDTPGLKLSYALVASENQHPKKAKIQLEALLKEDQHPNEAHYYLGRIADHDKKLDAAILQYYQVESGTHFYSAISRASALMIEQGKMGEALIKLDKLRNAHPNQGETLWEVEIDLLLTLKKEEAALTRLNDAIKAYPENDKLLYSRAMLYQKTGNIVEMEAEMRKLISKNPKDSMALNALGYTLADQTDRIEEAYNLISKAHKLKPNSPAILDSMGWVNYRKGNLILAQDYLERAYEKFPDPEVAAHLGEVLWQKGDKEKALQIWQQGVNKKPDHHIIQDAMARLGANFPKATTKTNTKP